MNDLPSTSLGVVIVAGGKGSRLGSSIPKQFLLLKGKPVLQWSLDCFASSANVKHIVITLPEDWLEDGQARLSPYSGVPELSFIQGGEQRQDSVLAGISALDPQIRWVAVHDGARPGITPEIVNTAFSLAQKNGSAVCAMNCSDTVVMKDQEKISEHIDRNTIMLVQTPQIFRREILLRALQHAKSAGISGTDDSGLVKAIGEPVFLAPGSYRNRKITTREDLTIVGALI